jgi:hypothetical protein
MRLTSKINYNDSQYKVGNQNTCTHDKSVSFTNMGAIGAGLTGVLRFIDSEPAIAPIVVDFSSMVAPRTLVESSRNHDALYEIIFRENSSAVLTSTIGLIGIGFAKLLSNNFDNKYNVKYSKIHADNETADMLADIWKQIRSGKNSANESVEEFFKEVMKKSSGLVNGEWKSFNEHDFSEEAKKLSATVKNNGFFMPKPEEELILTGITQKVKAKNNIKLTNHEGKEIILSLDEVIKNSYSMAKAFLSDKVDETFKQAKNADNIFLKDFKSLTNRKTIIAFSVIAAGASTLQTINRYWSKVRTGSDGFVGYKDFGNPNNKNNPTADKSLGFNLWKVAAAATMMTGAILSTGGKISQIPKKIQFKNAFPSINQLRLLFGVVVTGRLLAARDKNELRETAVRDYLSFANWLVFGGVAAKMAADKIDPSLVNCETKDGGSYWNKILKGHLVSYDEVVDAHLGKKVLNEAGKRLNYKEILGQLPEEAVKKVKSLNKANLAGLLYSSLTLGVFIPWLNTYMTDKNREKELKHLAGNNAHDNVIFTNRSNMTGKAKDLFAEFINK